MIRNLFRFRSLACAAALGLCVGSPMRADEKADLAQGAQKVFATYCYKCHGEAGRAEGVSFNFAIDLKKLVDTKRVAPGSPRNSKLFKRLTSEDDPMPPEFDDADTSASRKPLPRPGKDDVDVVRRWIEAGAPNGATAPAPRPRPFLAESEILQAIGEDLAKIDARYRGSARYFTITHLYNAGLSPDELLTYRNGLSKLVNSLSWGRRIVVPRPIDPAETIYRIDLRDFKWDEKVWQAILAHYPYGVTLDTDYAKGIYAATHCELPYVRADWFVFAASKPPLYHEVLQIPKTDRELEVRLQIDVAANTRQDLVARAGFNGSGVSIENNRMIERHESDLTNGAYWKSYDFAVSTGRKNLFAYPLGPGPGRFAFEHDGGEIIFNLPNGLQAYMLVKATGERLDVAPTAIVRDNVQPRGEVVNGISCMRCHARGIIEKDDQIGPAFAANAAAFPADVAATVAALYRPKAAMDALYKDDIERFARAVKQTGAALSSSEPVFTLSRKFESEMDLPLAASEAGVKATAFEQILRRVPALGQTLGTLLAPGGTIKRDVFVDAFPAIVKERRLGRLLAASPRPGGASPINSLGMTFAPIPAGDFEMGSDATDPDADGDEKVNGKKHHVTITRPFELGTTEVTVGQFRQFVAGANYKTEAERDGQGGYGWDEAKGTFQQDPKYTWRSPGFPQTDEHPVVNVSYNDAVAFCDWLTKQEGQTYRLPTEAEWEYSCRAGQTTRFSSGDDPETLATVGNVTDGTGREKYPGWTFAIKAKDGFVFTAPVGRFLANRFGLFDMHGNVWEWCADWYDSGYYSKPEAAVDPLNSSQAAGRVIRGGGWYYIPRNCRSAIRDWYAPVFRFSNLGFRVARVRSGP